MLVYREDDRPLDTRDALARLAAADGRPPLSILIDISELEAAVTDALMPDGDGIDPIAAAFRDASVEAAGVWISHAAGGSADTAALRRRIARLGTGPLPATV